MRLASHHSSNDYVVFVRRGCCVVMPWSRCGGARIVVQWAEGPWGDVRKLVDAILLGQIGSARREKVGELGFMLARSRWG